MCPDVATVQFNGDRHRTTNVSKAPAPTADRTKSKQLGIISLDPRTAKTSPAKAQRTDPSGPSLSSSIDYSNPDIETELQSAARIKAL